MRSITDFKAWGAWSREKKEPDLKRTFAGAPTGVGSTYAWEGKEVGLGQVGRHLMDMDRMVGRDFEAGLAALKAVAEKERSS